MGVPSNSMKLKNNKIGQDKAQKTLTIEHKTESWLSWCIFIPLCAGFTCAH